MCIRNEMRKTLKHYHWNPIFKFSILYECRDSVSVLNGIVNYNFHSMLRIVFYIIRMYGGWWYDGIQYRSKYFWARKSKWLSRNMTNIRLQLQRFFLVSLFFFISNNFPFFCFVRFEFFIKLQVYALRYLSYYYVIVYNDNIHVQLFLVTFLENKKKGKASVKQNLCTEKFN